MTYLVSIIVPCYNAEKYIIECLNSIIKQSYQNFEVIIIDDGSTDDSSFLINNYNDSRVSCIRTKNNGVSAARNKGLDLSSGSFIVFLDADDVLSEDFIKKRIGALLYSNAISSCSSIICINEKSEIIIFPYTISSISKIEQIFENTSKYFSCPSAYLFNKELLIESGIRFNEKLNSSADKFFLLELFNNNFIIHFDSSPLIYRISKDSMSNKISEKLLADKIAFKKEIINRNKFNIKSSYYSRLYYTIGGISFHLKKYYMSFTYLKKSFIHSPFTFISLLNRKLKV